MPTSSTDSIHKEISLSAPRSRVWRALADSAEFGQWFGVRLDGAFEVGESIRGRITHPGCEHMAFEAMVAAIEPESYFAFRWRPYATDPDTGDSDGPTTLVEFRLEPAGDGARLTVTESGFDALPADRRAESFARNEAGWAMQMESIERHVDG